MSVFGLRPGFEGEWRTSFMEMEIYRPHRDTQSFLTKVGNRAIGRAVENSRRVTCHSGEWRPMLGQRKQVDKVRKQLLMTHKCRYSQISAGPLTIRTLGRENYTPSLGLRKHSYMFTAALSDNHFGVSSYLSKERSLKRDIHVRICTDQLHTIRMLPRNPKCKRKYVISTLGNS